MYTEPSSGEREKNGRKQAKKPKEWKEIQNNIVELKKKDTDDACVPLRND